LGGASGKRSDQSKKKKKRKEERTSAGGPKKILEKITEKVKNISSGGEALWKLRDSGF